MKEGRGRKGEETGEKGEFERTERKQRKGIREGKGERGKDR